MPQWGRKGRLFMKRKRKMRRTTRHHLTPKSRNHSNSRPYNLLSLWWEKHQAWHVLFGNRTLEEIIEVLLRVKRFKDRHGRSNNGKLATMGDTLADLVQRGYRLPVGYGENESEVSYHWRWRDDYWNGRHRNKRRVLMRVYLCIRCGTFCVPKQGLWKCQNGHVHQLAKMVEDNNERSEEHAWNLFSHRLWSLPLRRLIHLLLLQRRQKDVWLNHREGRNPTVPLFSSSLLI